MRANLWLLAALVLAASGGIAPAQSLFVDPDTLSFAYTIGSARPAAQKVNVTADGYLNYVVIDPYLTPWLAVTVASDTTPSSFQVAVNPVGLPAGLYGSVLTVTTPGSITPMFVRILLTVYDAPRLILLPASLSLTYQPGQAAPASETVYVTASGKPVAFSASVSGAPWLDVQPKAGNTPANLTVAFKPDGLVPGTYAGKITVSSPDAPSQVLTVNLTVTDAAPVFAASDVKSLASNLSGPVAPGEALRITGTGFGGPSDLVAKVDASGRLATQLGDTQVLFDGVPAPLLLVGPSVITAFAPYEIAGRATTQLTVVFKGIASKPATLEVAPSAPGIFALGPSGTGQAAALNQDSSVNSAANPAPRGSIVTVYITGEGQTVPGGVDGLIARVNPPAPVLPVAVTIGGQTASFIYAGGAPGLAAGVAVVSAVIPRNIAAGQAPIQVTVGAATSQNGVTISVQ